MNRHVPGESGKGVTGVRGAQEGPQNGWSEDESQVARVRVTFLLLQDSKALLGS